MTPIVAMGIIALTIAFYLLPAIIAAIRGHASAWGIFALNLLLGWSGIIWIIALIWALSNKGQSVQQTVVVNHHQGNTAPPAQPIFIPVPQPSGLRSLEGGSQTGLTGMDTRTCPSCAETIKAAAVKCRFCGEQLNPMLLNQNPEM